jgi:RsiW-degrading membrane proteinase PrsW (M82 family)
MNQFICISGPDKNKRITLNGQAVLLGGSSSCHYLSDDAELGREKLELSVADGKLHFRATTKAQVFVDGKLTHKGMLGPGQQLRAGRSYWQFESAAKEPAVVANGLLGKARGALNQAIGLEQPEDFNVKAVFADVTRKRSDTELADIFTIGAKNNIPALQDIDTNWPRPWVFFKALVMAVLVYAGFVFAWKQFHNTNLIPGMIMVGASAIPLAVVIFYFEMNAPRNISLHQVLRMLLLGGVVSLITSLFGFNMFGQSLDWLGASQAGIIEESGKLLALLLIAHKVKYKWTLNGLVFGGAVGAGFAAFESAGYAFRSGLNELTIQTLGFGTANLNGVFDSILVRGLLTPGGHVAWTALVGAALWKVKGEQSFALTMLKDERFYRVFALAVGLHMIWNSPFGLGLPYYGKYLLLIGVAWMAIFGFIQDGLKQIRRAQETDSR